jgi:hypothetical protein
MSEQKSREELLVDYAAGPELLAVALEGLIESEMEEMSRATGEWTIRQIVHHINDADDLWKMCIKAALGDSGCRFDASWYVVRNGWAETLEYAGMEVGPALDLFAANRAHIVQMIQTLPDAWDRHVMFTLAGVASDKPLSVGEVIAFQVGHTQQHIDDIKEIRLKYGRSDPSIW